MATLHSRKFLSLVGLSIGLLAGSAASSQGASDAGQIFSTQCASCHGSTGRGGAFAPPLSGVNFERKWASRAALASYIKGSMPPSQPNSLTVDQAMLLASRLLAPARPASIPADTENTSQSQDRSSGRAKLKIRSEVNAQPIRSEFIDDKAARQVRQDRAAVLNRLSPVTDKMLRNPPAQDWLHWRRTLDAQGFSPLSGINKDNISKLATVWARPLPSSTNQIAPLVHDGVMFVNAGREVQALDATNGTLLWRYVRSLPDSYTGSFNTTQRSIAIYNGAIYLATGDRHVIALAMKDGQLLWDTPIVSDAEPKLVITSGPLVSDGVVVQGVAAGIACVGGCYIVGLDAETGQELWRRQTIAKPGEPGGNTWNDTPASERLGGGVWVTGSFDPELGVAYLGTGQTYHLYTLIGKDSTRADGLYTNSTLAMDLHSGNLRWYHQHLPGDVWDLDEVFERTLIDMPLGAKHKRLLVTIGKAGVLDALDRDTGKYEFSIDLGLQNLFSSIDPKTGRRTVLPAMVPKANVPLFVCPSVNGARTWMATSYNARSHMMFVPLVEVCNDITWKPYPDGKTSDDRVDLAFSNRPRKDADGNYGRLQAINLSTREIGWRKRQRAPFMSSVLATGGDLLFVGDLDGYFKALDQGNGNTLWSVRLNAAPNSTPISYEVNGQQYIAVTAGAGGPYFSLIKALVPEIDAPAGFATMWVFAVDKPTAE
jgi:alcohol dehydrogenase (cytochrome c)